MLSMINSTDEENKRPIDHARRSVYDMAPCFKKELMKELENFK